MFLESVRSPPDVCKVITFNIEGRSNVRRITVSVIAYKVRDAIKFLRGATIDVAQTLSLCDRQDPLDRTGPVRWLLSDQQDDFSLAQGDSPPASTKSLVASCGMYRNDDQQCRY